MSAVLGRLLLWPVGVGPRLVLAGLVIPDLPIGKSGMYGQIWNVLFRGMWRAVILL